MTTNRTLVAGGGPAAFALFLAARRQGRLQQLLDAGILVVEKTPTIGRGTIGDFAIRSDSHADSFVASAAVQAVPSMAPAFESAAGMAMMASLGQPVPLSLAADFLVALAAEFTAWSASQGRSPFLTGMRATCARRTADGWITTCRDEAGEERLFQSEQLVLATGARESTASLGQDLCGVPVLQRHGDKLVLSSDILSASGCTLVDRLLDESASPRVAIIGGSHSAISSARHLLGSRHGSRFGVGAVTVLHRRPFRLTYTSIAEAQQDGYLDFQTQDICPRTGRIYPLAGFRGDARALMRQSLGIAGELPDIRLRLLRLANAPDTQVQRVLNDADVIVSAVGYMPHALRLLDHEGQDIPLLCHAAPGLPLVDARSRVLDRNGGVIAGAYGIGLSSGFPLAGRFGEHSFVGQANGLALWQSTIGEELISQILDQTELACEPEHG